jgi:hypothetical protein
MMLSFENGSNDGPSFRDFQYALNVWYRNVLYLPLWEVERMTIIRSVSDRVRRKFYVICENISVGLDIIKRRRVLRFCSW